MNNRQRVFVATYKTKKNFYNQNQSMTVYVPKQESNFPDNENVVFENEQYLDFMEMLSNSFEIVASKCQKNGKFYRIKNSEIVCLQQIFLIKDKNCFCNLTPPQFFTTDEVNNDNFLNNYEKLIVENGTSITLKKSKTGVNEKLTLQSVSSEKTKNAKGKSKSNGFQSYWSETKVQKDLKEGKLKKGIIRINPKNYKEAYISNTNRSKPDYLIGSLQDRNRALEGDVVVFRFKPKKEWKEKQKTVTVVFIWEMVHPRIAVGVLKPFVGERKKKEALFQPRDNRIPRMKIPSEEWPPQFEKNPKNYDDTLFLVKLTEWTDSSFATGSIIKMIGYSFDFETETRALLLENELDISQFPPEALEHIPENNEKISEDEVSQRKDLRGECIFTIDPLTAKDLDDAVSCKRLDNGNYLVGVHISDVAYYLKENTILDKLVADKATSVYLVDNVYHMLPNEMCLHCSLLPGTDKLAFSVFWEMTSSGEIINTEFTRSIINSCSQLAYEHAQSIIENNNNNVQQNESDVEKLLPQIHNGFVGKDIIEVVRGLYEISLCLRRKRIDNGALQINQPKVIFRLDPETKFPIDWFVYENKEAHRLIEEFMLLANVSVAERLIKHYPDIAFLRCHDPPVQHMLQDLEKTMKFVGIDLDISSSAGIRNTLQYYSDDVAKKTVLNHLLAKPMARARYVCSGSQLREELYHYALSVSLYTHFTSPIRRYADIMVHRLMAASLGYTDQPQWTVENVDEIAANCNKKKWNAKRAGEGSCDLFLVHYIENHQPFVEDAVVCDVKDQSFDVVVITTGTCVRIYKDSLNANSTWSFAENDSRKQILISLIRQEEEVGEKKDIFNLVIEMLTVVPIELKRKMKTNKLEATLSISKLIEDDKRSSSSS